MAAETKARGARDGSGGGAPGGTAPSKRGHRKGGAPVERRCVVSRERAPRPMLLRLVLGPDGRPLVDVLGRAPGRAVYVRAQREALLEALSEKGVGRAWKGEAKALAAADLETIVDTVVARLEARVVELCTLARRAGQLALGHDAVLGALERGEAQVVCLARDLSERSEDEILSALPEGVEVARLSSKAELGAKLGKQELGIAAVLRGTIGQRAAHEAARLRGLTTSSSSTNAVLGGRVRARKKQATRVED